jgi:hypothetical protein
MAYIVVHDFYDLQDHNYSYKAGDDFPRLNHSVSEARIAELSSKRNRMGYPLISDTGASCAECAVEAVKQAVKPVGKTDKEIPVEKVKAARKPARSRKKE